jgi:hypothetical protein
MFTSSWRRLTRVPATLADGCLALVLMGSADLVWSALSVVGVAGALTATPVTRACGAASSGDAR